MLNLKKIIGGNIMFFGLFGKKKKKESEKVAEETKV